MDGCISRQIFAFININGFCFGTFVLYLHINTHNLILSVIITRGLFEETYLTIL